MNSTVDDLNQGGVLIYDSDQIEIEHGKFIEYGIPFQKIAREELEFVRGTNVLILGVMAGLFGLAPAPWRSWCAPRYKRRAELLEKNQETLHYGYEYTKKIQKKTRSGWAAPTGVPPGDDRQ